jgi:response regulator RpfG family c-di-GMP phosphodiesterase
MSNAQASELLSFADEDLPGEEARLPGWKVLVVDDEQEVHSVTRLALDGFTFSGRGLELLSAYSARRARELLLLHSDVALILLDVVMESEHAGLELVRYVREVINNPFVRIILRTGQPGQAPEREVVTLYDINDYKEKTELTAKKLFTVVYTALSAYRSLTGLDANRRGLTKVIEGCAAILEHQSVETFVQGVIDQVAALLFLDQDVLFVKVSGVVTELIGNRQVIIAATGRQRGHVGKDPSEVLPTKVNTVIAETLRRRRSLAYPDAFCGYLATQTGTEGVVYVTSSSPLTPPDMALIELFFHNVTMGLENLHLRRDVEVAQKELVYLLAGAVETRSHETGNHVRRVGEYSGELAILAGLGERRAEILRAAAPLHDVGKIGIPDRVLNHPSRLEEEHRQCMQEHTHMGAELLRSSKSAVIKAAAIIAAQHHENWDGSGYPNGLAGEEIHVYGRIVAIADVFDALGSKRSYKEPWPMEQVKSWMREHKGKKFDPRLTDLFLENFELFADIRERLPD